MITKISGGKVIADNIIKKTNVYLKDNKILAITDDALDFDNEIKADGLFVSPAFVEIHTHGAEGVDFTDGTVEAFNSIAKSHARHGTGSLAPTISTISKERMLLVLENFKKAKAMGTEGSELLGLHFEGPYFSGAQTGAQLGSLIRGFDKEEYEEIISKANGNILRWSAAPELEGMEDFAKCMKENNILAAIGHSDAESDVVDKAFELGFTHVTHLYSCTSMVHRKNAFRYTGIVESAYLNDDMTVEIIADGCHLPKELLKLVYKIKGPDKTALITDSVRPAGFPDGVSTSSNGDTVFIEDGVAKVADRSCFAGSISFSNRLVRNMLNMAEVPLTDVIKMAATTPAKIIGAKNKGRICEGYDADITIFDDDIDIKYTIVGGNTVYKKVGFAN